MVTDDVTVALDGSLLVKVTVTPPVGAGDDNVTGILRLWPGATATPEASAMTPGEVTMMPTVPPAKPADAPVIVPEPSLTPVTLNDALVLPAGMLTVGGLNEIKPPGETERATLTPPTGAGELSVTVPSVE